MGRAGRAPRDAAADDGIEFVAPRRDLFGGIAMAGDDEADLPLDGAFADADDERPARWTTALAGLGVASLIAVGVVAAAPWNEEEAPPATSAPASTAPSTTATSDDGTASTEPPATASTSPWAPGEDPFAAAAAGGPPVGYLLDPATLGDGFITQIIGPAAEVRSDQPSWIDVWATPGASSLTGDWVSVEVSPWPTAVVTGGVAERVAVGDRVGLVEPWSDFPQLVFAVQDHTVVVTASRSSTDELSSLAAGIELADGRPVYPEGGIAGHELVVSRASPGWGVLSELPSLAESTFGWFSETGDWVQVTTRPADDAADVALRQLFLLPIGGEPYSGPGARVVVGGRVVTVGRPLGGVGIEATFDERGRTVTVTLEGDDDLDTLLEYVHPARLRAGSTSEWLELQFDLLPEQDASTGGSTSGANPVDAEQLVMAGTLADGTAWTVTRLGGSSDEDPTYGIGLVGVDGSATPAWAYTTPSQAPSVSVGIGGALAVVVVDASTGAVELRAGTPGDEMVVTELAAVPAGSDGVPAGSHLLVGILPFDVLGPWVAEVIDGDGTVIGTTASDGTSAVQ